MSNDDVQVPAAQNESSVDRRRFIIGTAAAGAGMWAAPSILSVDRAFAQGVGSPPPGGGGGGGVTCMTSARDITVRASGLVPVAIGPFSSCTSTGGGSVLDINVPVVTARVLTTACSQDPCRAFAEIASASINLGSLGIPLTIAATALTAEAVCSGGSTGRASSIATLTLTSGLVTQNVAVQTAPNSTVNLTVGAVTVTVVFNEQPPGTGTVNAVRVTASVVGVETIDVIIASATATCSS